MKNELTDTKSVKINSSNCLHRNEFRKKKKKNIQKHYKIPKLGNILKKLETRVWGGKNKKKKHMEKRHHKKDTPNFPIHSTKHLQFSDIKRSDIQQNKYFCLSHNTIIF